jgi:DNA-binding transcriptional ArsR family regulator
MMTKKKYQEEKSNPVHKISEKKDVIINTLVGYSQSFCKNNNINNSQFNTLQIIAEAKPKSISELSRLRYLTRTTINRHLIKLQERGLVEVEQVTDDFKYLGSKIKTNLSFYDPPIKHDYENPEFLKNELGNMFTCPPSGELFGQEFAPILHMNISVQQQSKESISNNNNKLPEGNCLKNKQRIPEKREKTGPTPRRRIIKREKVSALRRGLYAAIPSGGKFVGIEPRDISELAAKLYDAHGYDEVFEYLRSIVESGVKFPANKCQPKTLFEEISKQISPPLPDPGGEYDFNDPEQRLTRLVNVAAARLII